MTHAIQDCTHLYAPAEHDAAIKKMLATKVS